tara:strand:+ start:64 stop:1422 length:1359 start_codon:yes stop_codon:yes gene_type:complete
MIDTKITWVNHAGYVLSHKNINFLVDPWHSGTAFNNGWALLADTYFPEQIAKSITHIWISHEHPDHFSSQNLIQLRKINKEKIKVFFQETKDKRVCNFLKKIGFDVHELKDYEEYKILNDFKIQIVKSGQIDSLSFFNVADKLIINTNDCDLSLDFLQSAKKKFNINKSDILLAQFSYAYWIGKPNEKFKRELASKEKLEQIIQQVKILKPKITIPFASYIYYCHSENKYMNDSITSLTDVKTAIEKEKSEAVFLYPGSEYKLNEKYSDSAKNLEKYVSDFNSLSSKKYLNSPSVSLDDLKISSKKYLESLYKKNSKFVMYLFCLLSKLTKIFLKKDFFGFANIHIYITDLSTSINFDWIKGICISKKETADVSISSDSLNYIFKYQWGIGSIMINGRGDYKNEYSKWLFNRMFVLGLINSVEETLLSRTLKKITSNRLKLHEVEPSFLSKK